MTDNRGRYIDNLLPRFDRSPTPYHAVDTIADELAEVGFSEYDEGGPFPTEPGRHFTRRGGSLVAWSSAMTDPATGFRVIGAHTDSPNLRIKPKPDGESVGWSKLGVEVYGGALLNSWLDRELGLAGRVAVRDGDVARTVLFHDDRPLLRVPQLAVHLDREVNDRGLILNRQQHLNPVWGAGDVGSFVEYLADQTGSNREDVLGWDAMVFDINPACVGGLNLDFLVSGRIDNLLSCFVAADALKLGAAEPGPHTKMICLFDHEEVGSVSTSGAGGPLLDQTIARIVEARGGAAISRGQAITNSMMVSADGAHATHPNYVDRHEKDHTIEINSGPVLKINSNQRYATDAVSAAEFRLSCEAAKVPMQTFVNRSDLACGSTIGPLTSGRLGIPVVDAGCAQLGMHSAREMAGSADPEMFRDALAAFLRR